MSVVPARGALKRQKPVQSAAECRPGACPSLPLGATAHLRKPRNHDDRGQRERRRIRCREPDPRGLAEQQHDRDRTDHLQQWAEHPVEKDVRPGPTEATRGRLGHRRQDRERQAEPEDANGRDGGRSLGREQFPGEPRRREPGDDQEQSADGERRRVRHPHRRPDAARLMAGAERGDRVDRARVGAEAGGRAQDQEDRRQREVRARDVLVGVAGHHDREPDRGHHRHGRADQVQRTGARNLANVECRIRDTGRAVGCGVPSGGRVPSRRGRTVRCRGSSVGSVARVE